MEEVCERYADAATHHTVEVIENRPLARDTFRLRFRCPEVARVVRPGQFVMVRLADYDDPLIGRPLAMYDVASLDGGSPDAVDVVYLVSGKMTSHLRWFQPGQRINVWGPLGNGFPPQSAEHLIMVAGGIGQTPFVALAKEALGRQTYGNPARSVPPVRRVTLCYGARNAAFLAGIPDFENVGVDVKVSTDDGSAGQHGLVTELLDAVLQQSSEANCRVVCCGPEPMMRAVARLTRRFGVPTQVSLETPMACGIGICFSCVAEIYDARGEADYRRTCIEGPVFDAQRVKWD